MKLALSYGLFRADFEISPEEMILADNHLLNELIDAENEAMKKAREKNKDESEHPGMERGTMDEFWEEVEAANKGAKAS